MHKVTSAKFLKEFGHFQMEAHKDAVIITNHARDDLALISAEEYARLRQLDRPAFYTNELPQEIVDELGTVDIPKAANQFDDEYEAS